MILKNIFGRLLLGCAVAFTLLSTSSCKKELAAPPSTGNESVIIFIRAIDKDSTIVNSEQIRLF